MNILKKLWEKTRGYKRNVGSAVVILPTVATFMGVPIPDDIMLWIYKAGSAMYLLGWADKGLVAVWTKRMQGQE